MPQAAYRIMAFSLILATCPGKHFTARSQTAQPPIELPNKPKSVRFAVIGDMGTGTKEQYQVSREMALADDRFSFDFVLILGDNIYGSKTPADYKRKFEDP